VALPAIKNQSQRKSWKRECVPFTKRSALYMAQYKVPQDVEADDKLLGPFSFRQFIYLMVTAGFIAAAWALFQVFPILGLIPLPIVIIFGVLALPLRKDQPMETYLAAIVSFFLKPKKRLWHAGQRESTILITAPKVVEKQLTKSITGEEASRRLSFLAEIADTEGRSIKSPSSAVKEEFVAEANAIDDMFTTVPPKRIDEQIDTEAVEQRTEAVEKMRAAIENFGALSTPAPKLPTPAAPPPDPTPPPQNLANLAENSPLTVATVAKEANRIANEKENEVYISLH